MALQALPSPKRGLPAILVEARQIEDSGLKASLMLQLVESLNRAAKALQLEACTRRLQTGHMQAQKLTTVTTVPSEQWKLTSKTQSPIKGPLGPSSEQP